MPPEMIAGRYRVEREVGRGGMGSVWLCRDERLGRDVAVKQVGGLPGESSMHLARALREARHSAALNHPNVVAIFDALEEGDHVWLVMEYVPSRTLAQILRDDGPMEPQRAAWIGAQVAEGLAAAHALGTVHRDVKPSNILVRDDGRALIADFGIARTLGQEQLTSSGMVTGTPVYFAPELARGSEPSPASDVWALGVSVYAAVEGAAPYADQVNAIALLNTIAHQPAPAPTRAGRLTEAIGGMMAPDPATRWTMARVAAELRALAAAPPAPPAPMAEEHPTRLLEPLSTPPAQEPGHGSRRGRGTPLVLAALLLLVGVAVGGWWLTRDPDDEATADSPLSRSTTAPTQADAGTAPTAPQDTGRGASGEPAPEGSATSSSPSDEPAPTESATPPGSGANDAEALVTDYYSRLPEDPDASWSMLSPSLQDAIGEDSFYGFWATIDDVRVEDVEETGESQVRVTIVYTTGGRDEQETRVLKLEEGDAGLLITADSGPV